MTRELDPENRLARERGSAKDGVGTVFLVKPIRGFGVPASSSQRVAAGRDGEDLPSTVLVLSIREQLEQHPHFRGRGSLLTIELVDDTIVLSGRLPSYYLKQLLQEAVLVMPGVVRLDNQILVFWPSETSSGPVEAAWPD